MHAITEGDKAILRELAKRQMEHAQSEKNRESIKEWYQHNACRGQRPMIHLELGTFEEEVIPPLIRCVGEEARQIEATLYSQFLNRELFDDDRPVPDYYPVHWDARMLPFGLEVERSFASAPDGNQLGHKFTHHIADLEEDFHLIQPGTISFDRAAVLKRIEEIGNIFGDILPPKLVTDALYSVPTQDVVHIMGMETMFVAMCDYPELFHRMMRQYTDDTIRFYRFMEEERLLLPTTACEGLGQGTWCFTDELPHHPADGSLRTVDLWGFMDSQETVGVSPQMFGEFIFPYYKEISAQFGLMSYGCCEPVHPIWDDYLSTLEHLRKVSISPWCDEKMMAERLRGRKTIFHRKPSPNYLGVGATLDEDAFRGHIRDSILAAKGLTMEITQRDVYSINHDIPKAKRYVDIIKEEIVNLW